MLEFGKISYKISIILHHFMGKNESWRIIGIHFSSILVNHLGILKRHKNKKTHKWEDPWYAVYGNAGVHKIVTYTNWGE